MKTALEVYSHRLRVLSRRLKANKTEISKNSKFLIKTLGINEYLIHNLIYTYNIIIRVIDEEIKRVEENLKRGEEE